MKAADNGCPEFIGYAAGQEEINALIYIFHMQPLNPADLPIIIPGSLDVPGYKIQQSFFT